MKSIPIMQKDGPRFESWFVLQHEETREAAKDTIFRLTQKRKAKNNDWPKWSLDGFTY